MKWTFFVQQKLKVALLLGLVMCLVLLFNLFLQKNISDISNSINSIYKDRLIPATDIFYLSENLHNRQHSIEKFLLSNDDKTALQLRTDLEEYQVKILQLISKYEKTYLVDEELFLLQKFKKNVAEYAVIERRIISIALNNNKAEAKYLYEISAQASLEKTIAQLSDLTSIQSTVGNKLLTDTQSIVSLSNLLSSLQLILAVIIGLMIIALVAASKIINQPQAKFKWN